VEGSGWLFITIVLPAALSPGRLQSRAQDAANNTLAM
jgi:hypothetical protein